MCPGSKVQFQAHFSQKALPDLTQWPGPLLRTYLQGYHLLNTPWVLGALLNALHVFGNILMTQGAITLVKSVLHMKTVKLREAKSEQISHLLSYSPGTEPSFYYFLLIFFLF